MPELNIGGDCCICVTPLGSSGCENPVIGIANVYYTCPKNIAAISYLAAENACAVEGEIASFGLSGTAAENLLQPINFEVLDDDSGAVHEWEDVSENGNVSLNHTFKIKVKTNTPNEEAALRKLLGREVALVVEYKSGRWKIINHKGGMKAKKVSGNSNQSFRDIEISGKATSRPLFISHTDNGDWAKQNLIASSEGGMLNL